jgi:uncharacterized protein DUF5819
MPDHHRSGTAQLDAAADVDLPAQHPESAVQREADSAPDAFRGTLHEGPSSPPARWSVCSRLLLRAAAATLACATAWHLAAVFFSIAPANMISQRYQREINAYIGPEFQQNWQLFAPNPISANTAIEVRVQTLTAHGNRPQSGWVNLTAQDVSHIRGDPFPSHANQNLLRRAWDYYTYWHNSRNDRSLGSQGPMSQEYVKRIALQRLGRDWKGNPITAIQVRSAVTPIAGPAWTGAQQKPRTSYWTLPSWPVTDDDYEGLGG